MVKKSNKDYYFINLHNKKLRIQFQEKTEDGDYKNCQIERSLSKYGMKKAKNLLLSEYSKRTGKKVKYYQLNEKELKEQEKKEEEEKQPETDEPENLKKVNTINDIDWNKKFKDDTGYTMIFVAKSKSVKTTAMTDIWNNYLKHIWDVGVLSSNTISADIYKGFKGVVKMNGLNDTIVKLLYRIQKHSKSAYNLGFIFDDLSSKDRNSEIFTQLLTFLRNIKLSTVILSQDFKLSNPLMRGSVNYWLISNTHNMEKDRIDMIFDLLIHYFKCWKDLPISKQRQKVIDWVNEHTKDYNFIFLDTLNNEIILTTNNKQK